ncbi:unnamed protein product [Blepharisma stoltei]|uniref:RNase III domain-containing protein n=1 Tax=Blepharisma stoltei TaxID=1481888 RepID=A0AAU9KEB0_9CILI|nr:unnamed protein product [Blepharisma stoltei]
MDMEIDADPTKKLKTESFETYNIRSYADILSQPFLLKSAKYEVYFYKFFEISQFGILFPIEFKPCPDFIQFVKKRKLWSSELNSLREFQHVMWCDLFQVLQVKNGNLSNANYLVVPVKKKRIDWDRVKNALYDEELKTIREISINDRPNYMYQSVKKRHFLQYVKTIMPDEETEKILNEIFDQAVVVNNENNTVTDRRILVKAMIDKKRNNDNYKPFIIAKNAKPVRRMLRVVTSTTKSPNNYQILSEDEMQIFYLNSVQYEEATHLLVMLSSLESVSYIIQFAKLYNYTGSFTYLRNGLTAPSLDNDSNYDALENLGDVILKVIASLHFFSKYEKDREHYLTWRRTEKIKNDYLSKIAKRHDFKNYLRTRELKYIKLRPPYYEGQNGKDETDQVLQRISDGQLADMVESLIGAFFMGEGMLNSAKFVYQLDVLPEEEQNWAYTLQYFDNEKLTVLDIDMISSDILCENPSFGDIIPPMSEKHPCGDLFETPEMVEDIIGYKFKDKSLLFEAFTHASQENKTNYERLEFLGDSLLDLIVVSNTFLMGNFNAEELTTFKHIIANNNVLSKLAISLGLYRFLKCDLCQAEIVDKFLDTVTWDEDICNFGAYDDDPPKCLNDIFEALAGAILIDSGSLRVVSQVFGSILKLPMIHLVRNNEKCGPNIRSRLSVYGQRARKKIRIEESDTDLGCLATVYIDEIPIVSHYSKTRWLAKQQAALKAYQIVTKDQESAEIESN